MNRTQKVEAVQELNQVFSSTPHVILATFRGLTVNQTTELRRKVRGVGGRLQVIKNRLAMRAAVGTPMEELAGRLAGPCAVAIHDSDPVALAKSLAEFSKANPQIELLAGVIDAGSLLEVAEVKQLAALPGLDELRAQLLSLLQTPAGNLVRMIGAPGSQLARVLDAQREQLEGSS